MQAHWLMVLAALAGCGGSPATPAGGAPSAASPGAAAGQSAECVALIDIVNHGVEALEKMDGYAGLDDLEKMATIRDAMAHEIEGVGPKQPELRAWAAEYPKTLRQTSAALRSVAAAARRGDASVRGDGARDLDAAMKREEPLVDRVNALCHRQ